MGIRILILLCMAAGVLLPASQAAGHSAPDLLLNYHFRGMTKVLADTNASALKDVWLLRSSVQVREQAMSQLAAFPGKVLRTKTAKAPQINTTPLIRPLLDDLLDSESYLDVRRPTNGAGEMVFAIRLSESRAALWNSNLVLAVEAWTGKRAAPVNEKEFSGWEIKRQESPSLIRFLKTKEWVVFGVGEKELPLQQNALKAIAKGSAPAQFSEGNWFEADIDWPRLSQWIPLTNSPLKLARTQINLSSKSGNVRTTVRAVYPQKLKFEAKPWKVPTSLIKDPINSFVAAQGLETFVTTPAAMKDVGISPYSEQFYVWAHVGSPFHTSFAMPSKDADRDLQRLGRTLPATFNGSLKRGSSTIVWETNRNEISWRGLSVIVPFLQATNTPAGGFLYGGLFPPLPLTNNVPPELFEQLKKKNLLYYGWEITQHRLGQWQMLGQMLPIPRPVPAEMRPVAATSSKTNAPVKVGGRLLEQRWIAGMAPHLGNSVTEITQTGPNELTLTRKSHCGFTAFELMLLGQWFTSADFPAYRPESPKPITTVPPPPTQRPR